MNILKASIAFTGGLLVGFVSARVLYLKYYETMAQEQIDSVKDAYRNLTYETKVVKKETQEPKQKTKKQKNLVTNKNSLAATNGGNGYVKTLKNYNDLSTLEDGEFFDIQAPDVEEEYIFSEPFIITKDEFDYEFEEFDKVSMNFYTSDEILSDENDDKIDTSSAMEMIGEHAFNILCNEQQERIIYVRSKKTCTDYEIGTILDSFRARELQNQVKDERKRKKKVVVKEEVKPIEEKVKDMWKKNLTPREIFENRKNTKKGD